MYGVTRRYVDAGEIVNDIKDAYSMNWSIQKMLTADEYGEYVAAVEGYSERKLKGKAFYFSRITMCDAAYILAVKKHDQPSMEQYLDEVCVRVQKVEKLDDDGNIELREALGKLEEALENTEISVPTMYQYSLNLAEEHSVKEWTTLLQDHLAFLKEAESHFSSFQKFKDTKKWKFISEFSLLGKVYARMMSIMADVTYTPDCVIIYDTLRRTLEKDSSIDCNDNCKKALEILSEGATEERCGFVVGSVYYNRTYDVEDVAQEAYKAGVQSLFQTLVKAGYLSESQENTRLKTEVENLDIRDLEAFFSDVLFERVIDSTEKLQQDDQDDDFYY